MGRLKFFVIALAVFSLAQTPWVYASYAQFPVAEGMILAFVESLGVGLLCATACLFTAFPANGVRNWVPGLIFFVVIFVISRAY